MFCCVLLYQADRRDVICHLVGRGCGMMRLCVLGANARFPTGYDSKGYGLMSLAGHTPRHWPVSSRPCDCRTPRPALHRIAWEAGFLTHNFGTRNSYTHTHNSFTRNFTHNSFTPIHNYFTTSTHTQPLHTQLFHRHRSHRSNTHTQLFHIQLLLNLSIPHHLLCLSFLPRPASTFVSVYWKKLTCGVIRSFN